MDRTGSNPGYSKTDNIHEKITQFWLAEKGIQFFWVQITNSFWLADNTKETAKNQSKFKKMAMVFRKRRFDFVRKATIEKLFKEIFLKLEHSKKYIFLAKCIENVVVREK